jgi:hypothetical protein
MRANHDCEHLKNLLTLQATLKRATHCGINLGLLMRFKQLICDKGRRARWIDDA